jgi:hypothetical protein
MLPISSDASPGLLKLTVCDELVVCTRWLPNVRLEAERLAAGFATPVPVRATVCGLEAALSVMIRNPVRAPAAVGVKVTEMVHSAPAARLGTQVSVAAKSPLAAMRETLSATLP